MAMLFCVGSYLFAVLLSYRLAVLHHRRLRRINEYNQQIGLAPVPDCRKLPRTSMLLMALLFTLSNVAATELSTHVGGDRTNYLMNIQGIRPSSSAGLQFVVELLRLVAAKENVLFYVSTFFTVFITLEAYRVNEAAIPPALLFLLTTQYVFNSFSVLKQSYANAFAALGLMLAMRRRDRRDTVWSLVMLALSVWFHPSGFILVPLYLLVRMKKANRMLGTSLLVLFVTGLLLEPLLLRAAAILLPIAPKMAYKILEYFGETANDALQSAGSMTVLKGIPFFFVTTLGWVKRRQLSDRISNYDNYLLLSSILSFIYVFSIYNAWIYRLSYYFYLPVGVFFAQLMRNVRNDHNYALIYSAVLGINLILSLRFVVMVFLRYGGF